MSDDQPFYVEDESFEMMVLSSIDYCVDDTYKNKIKELKALYHAFHPIISLIDVFCDLEAGYLLRHEEAAKKFLPCDDPMSVLYGIASYTYGEYLIETLNALYVSAGRSLRFILEVAVAAYTAMVDKSIIKRENTDSNCSMTAQDFMEYIELTHDEAIQKRIIPPGKTSFLLRKLKERKHIASDEYDVILKLYKELCNFIHLSIPSGVETIAKRYFTPFFDEADFNVVYRLGMNVLDVIGFLIIKAYAIYRLNYKNLKQFIRDNPDFKLIFEGYDFITAELYPLISNILK